MVEYMHICGVHIFLDATLFLVLQSGFAFSKKETVLRQPTNIHV